MKEPAIEEQGEALRIQEPASAPESAAPRELRTLGYEAGAQRVRPKGPGQTSTSGGVVEPRMAQKPAPEGGGTTPLPVSPSPVPDGPEAQTGVTAKSPIDEKLAWWQTHAPKADYRKVTFRGVRCNKRTVELIKRAEAIMRDHFGHEKFQFSFSQGSYNSGYAASGNTHDGGGALDIRVGGYSKHVVNDMVRSLRMAGFAAWSRGRGYDSFDPHIHGIAIGDKEASPNAKSQVNDYGNKQNGLSNHAEDPDKGLGAKPPKWAKKHL